MVLNLQAWTHKFSVRALPKHFAANNRSRQGPLTDRRVLRDNHLCYKTPGKSPSNLHSTGSF